MDIILPSDISDDCSKNDYGKERKIAAIAAIAAAATSAINGSAGTMTEVAVMILMKHPSF
jgi:hypothetical protein